MKKIRISELPLSQDLQGLYTIGVDARNKSVKVPLGEYLLNLNKYTSGSGISITRGGAVSVNVSPSGGLGFDSDGGLEIADKAITNTKIADNTIITSKLANGAVMAGNIGRVRIADCGALFSLGTDAANEEIQAALGDEFQILQSWKPENPNRKIYSCYAISIAANKGFQLLDGGSGALVQVEEKGGNYHLSELLMGDGGMVVRHVGLNINSLTGKWVIVSRGETLPVGDSGGGIIIE